MLILIDFDSLNGRLNLLTSTDITDSGKDNAESVQTFLSFISFDIFNLHRQLSVVSSFNDLIKLVFGSSTI